MVSEDLSPRKPVFEVFDHVIRKSGCTATENGRLARVLKFQIYEEEVLYCL